MHAQIVPFIFHPPIKDFLLLTANARVFILVSRASINNFSFLTCALAALIITKYSDTWWQINETPCTYENCFHKVSKRASHSLSLYTYTYRRQSFTLNTYIYMYIYIYRNRGHGLDRGLIKRTKSTKRSRFACQGRFSTRGHNSTFGKPPSRSPGTLSYFWRMWDDKSRWSTICEKLLI